MILRIRKVDTVKLRKRLLGANGKTGIIPAGARYAILSVVAFVFVYPVLYMIVQAFMSEMDVVDSSVTWIPTSFSFSNFRYAMQVMDYVNSLRKTLILVMVPTILQTLVSSMIGYGFARYNFPGKKIYIAVLLLMYLLPSTTTSIPNYILMRTLNLCNGTVLPFALTSGLGQGINGSLCVLIFYNFHRQVPRSLLEAAEIDGAGHLGTYLRIAVPMASAGLVVVSVFSIVWYWNDTYLVTTYLGYGHTRYNGLTTLMLELIDFNANYPSTKFTSTDGSATPSGLNDAYRMAGTVMSVLPVMVMYLLIQRQFVASVDNAGITGE